MSARKRPRKYEEWKAVKAKKARASGEAYTSPYNGNLVPARYVEPDLCDEDG